MRSAGSLGSSCITPLLPQCSSGNANVTKRFFYASPCLHTPKVTKPNPPKGSPASAKFMPQSPPKGSPASQRQPPPPPPPAKKLSASQQILDDLLNHKIPTPSKAPVHSKIPTPSATVVSSIVTSKSSTSSTSSSTVSTFTSTTSTSTTISVSTSTLKASFMAPDISAASAAAAASSTIHEVVPESMEADVSKFKVTRTMMSPYGNDPPSTPTKEPKGPRFSILQYNVLTNQIDVVPQYYYCPEYAQTWDYRGPNLVREIRSYNPDIVCLQEVDKYDFFKDELTKDAYIGIYEPRPYKHLDGLALFYKKDKFKLIKKYIVNYNKIHMPVKDPNSYYLENRFGFINRGKSKYETNNIALVCELETIEETPRRLFVATTHIYWNPKMPELKVLQSYTLLKELEKIFKIDEKTPNKKFPPLVITGDFNAMPESGAYQLYATQNLPRTHADIQSLALKDLSHYLPIRSAYSGLGEPLTNITKGFVGTLDYIWYGNNQLAVNRVLSPITDAIEKYGGMPNLQFSSDHSALMCELDFLE